MMKLTGDRREVLILFASKEKIPLYEIMKLNQANFRARISELRDPPFLFTIPAPVLKKNRQGRIMSTYSMPVGERMRARALLDGRGR